MIRNLDPSAEQFLAALERIQATAERAMRQISTGLRVNSASDAADSVSDILDLRSSLARNAQIQQNLGRLQSEADAAERVLSSAVTALDRALTLGSQGASSFVSAQTRQILASEVESILANLVAASRTMVEGRYLFSGDRDQEPQYELDLLSPTGVNRRFTTQASRRVEHPNGTTFVPARTAEEIFDHRNPDDSPASDNVFAALNSLRLALQANDESAIGHALTAIRTASTYLNGQLAFYGTVQATVRDALDFAGKMELRLRSELSSKEDADLARAITELQHSRTHEEAALRARAQWPRVSLFDFLG
nr:hypothetical protein [Bryobacteraceae bacterium]MDW8355247.1 hypothetical protein [Bryobacterales bacterium]